MAGIKEDEWFKQGYSPVNAEEEDDDDKYNDDKPFSMHEVVRFCSVDSSVVIVVFGHTIEQ